MKIRSDRSQDTVKICQATLVPTQPSDNLLALEHQGMIRTRQFDSAKTLIIETQSLSGQHNFIAHQFVEIQPVALDNSLRCFVALADRPNKWVDQVAPDRMI